MMLALIAEALVYRMTDGLTALAPLAALALAAVFAVAAVAKWTSPATTARELADLGLPAPTLLGRLLPPTEIVVAVLLVARPAVGALVATLLLLAFTAVLLAALRSGRSVSCGCLGPLSRRPVSGTTIARNGALLALAALASVGPMPEGLTPALPALDVTLSTGMAALLVALGYQLMTLRGQIGRLWSVELAGEGPTGSRRGRNRRSAPTEGNLAVIDETVMTETVMNGAGS